MMTPIESLKWRYATKQFDSSRTISDTDWAALEESLILTPSSFGLQPWSFVIVSSEEVKAALKPHSWDQSQITDCSHLVVMTARTEVTAETINHWLARLSEVQGKSLEDLAVYKGILTQFTQSMTDAEIRDWSQRQTYIALGQLMAVAAAMGIDACPLEGIVPVEYDSVLNLGGSGFFTTVACALGYRSDQDKYASVPKARFPSAEVIKHV